MDGVLNTSEMKWVLHTLETQNVRTQFQIGFIKPVDICNEISKYHVSNSHQQPGRNGLIGQKRVHVDLVEFIELGNVLRKNAMAMTLKSKYALNWNAQTVVVKLKFNFQTIHQLLRKGFTLLKTGKWFQKLLIS